MKSFAVTPAHRAFMADVKAAMGKHPTLSALEILALTSQLVGNLIALQDQTKITPATALQVVSENIEEGNRQAIGGLMDTQGTA